MTAAPNSGSAPVCHFGFIGTATEPNGSRGLYALTLDAATGTLAAPVLAAEAPSPNYLALNADRTRLYALSDCAALSVGFRVAGQTLTPLAPPSPRTIAPPSHIAVDATGRLLVCSIYHDSTVATVGLASDGAPVSPPTGKIPHAGVGPNTKRQDKPHPHSAVFSPDNRFVYVCDLGADKIYIYEVNLPSATLIPATPPFAAATPGCGPRHSAISADGKFLYVVNEMANTMVVYTRDLATGSLTAQQTISTLPSEFTSESITAEIRLRADGRFLYVSNRGHESIAVFARDAANGQLALVEIVGCGGKHPRNFSLTPDGAWLIVSNRDSNNLAVFSVAADSGRLTWTSETALTKPMCSVWVS